MDRRRFLGALVGAPVAAAAVALPAEAEPVATEIPQTRNSIYLNIAGHGSVEMDELVEAMTRQIADGGHRGRS